MAIPNNILKEHLVKAIEKIDSEGIPKDGDSQYYDVIYNGKKYPPKLVVSFANIFANGIELDRNTFNGGEETQCFKLLRLNGFVIDKKNNTAVTQNKIWIEKTLVNKRSDRLQGEYAVGRALWTPQSGRNGADVYARMRELIEGDTIIHLTDNKAFTGISRVKSPYTLESIKLNTPWDGNIFKVELKDYTKINPLDRKLILNKNNRDILTVLKGKYNVFYNSELNLNQGAYLTECPVELAYLINSAYYDINNHYIPHLPIPPVYNNPKLAFTINDIYASITAANIFLDKLLCVRFVASILTKPFIILTGLSGSGKTKLAQAFVKWICKDESQYRIVPVGADWTNREPLLGYPNALQPEEYVKPESGVLDLIIQANNQPELPHFLILDEMNLSHVERYFADFLSAMESREEIHLFAEDTSENSVPSKLKIPSNLYIIGTVNIDETTNMFSPKVLDRANTIEFRVTQEEMKNFLGNIKDINMSALTGKGAGMAKSFIEMAASKEFATADITEINEALVQFFGELKKTGAEFGYRSATEILRLIHQLTVLDNTLTTHQKIDIAIMQKLLPKLHGSRRKLCPVLEMLGSFCITGNVKIVKDVFEKVSFDFNDTNVLYPLSLEKIARMYRGAIDNGFASFAEA